MEKSSPPIPVDGSDDLFIITNRIGMLQIAKKEKNTDGKIQASCKHMYFDLNEAKSSIKNGVMCKNCINSKEGKKKTIATNNESGMESDSRFITEDVHLYKNGVATKLTKEEETKYLDQNEDKFFVRTIPSVGLLFCKNGIQASNGDSIQSLNQYPMYGIGDQHSFLTQNRNIVNLDKITNMLQNFREYGFYNKKFEFDMEYYELKLIDLKRSVIDVLNSVFKKILDKKVKEIFDDVFFTLDEIEEFRIMSDIQIDYNNIQFSLRYKLQNVVRLFFIAKFFDKTENFGSMQKAITALSERMINSNLIQKVFNKKMFASAIRYILISLLYNDSAKKDVDKFQYALELFGLDDGSSYILHREELQNFIADELKSFSKKRERFISKNGNLMEKHRKISNEIVSQNLMNPNSDFYQEVLTSFKEQVQENKISFIRNLDLAVEDLSFIGDFFDKTLSLKQTNIEKFYQNKEFLIVVREINQRIEEYVKVFEDNYDFLEKIFVKKSYSVPEVVINDERSPIEIFLKDESIDITGRMDKSRILELILDSSFYYDINVIFRKYESYINEMLDDIHQIKSNISKCSKLLKMDKQSYMYLNPSPMFDVGKHKYFIENSFPVQFMLDPSQNDLVYNYVGSFGALFGNLKIRHIIVLKSDLDKLLELLNFIGFEKEVYITSTDSISLTKDRLTLNISTKKMDSIIATKKDKILKRAKKMEI